jgi:DNA-binding transcriptional regulator YiaG
MDPAEIHAIVNRHGGTTKFAAKLKVSTRIVQYWLAGERRIRPVIEDRIRELPNPSTNQRKR